MKIHEIKVDGLIAYRKSPSKLFSHIIDERTTVLTKIFVFHFGKGYVLSHFSIFLPFSYFPFSPYFPNNISFSLHFSFFSYFPFSHFSSHSIFHFLIFPLSLIFSYIFLSFFPLVNGLMEIKNELEGDGKLLINSLSVVSSKNSEQIHLHILIEQHRIAKVIIDAEIENR